MIYTQFYKHDIDGGRNVSTQSMARVSKGNNPATSLATSSLATNMQDFLLLTSNFFKQN
jgi:hypothetical protein